VCHPKVKSSKFIWHISPKRYHPGITADRQPQWAPTYCYLWQSTASKWKVTTQWYCSEAGSCDLRRANAPLCRHGQVPPQMSCAYSYTTKKWSKNTLPNRPSFCCSTTVLFKTGAPKPWLLLSYQRTMLAVKASMFHLPCIILSETFCGWGSRKRSHFSTCECCVSTLCHTLQRCMWSIYQSFKIKAGVCCVRLCNVSILKKLAFVLTVASKKDEIKHVPWLLLSSLEVHLEKSVRQPVPYVYDILKGGLLTVILTSFIICFCIRRKQYVLMKCR
jgi:hypothetical protein